MDAGRRALRVLFVANDGFSAGHVARALAIARGLSRRAPRRNVELRLLLATTSEAHSLLGGEELVVVRLPPPQAARRAGFSDQERRRIVRGALEGVADSFAPDLIVADTFPSGPHGELAGIGVGRARRALVRRSLPEKSSGDEILTSGLLDYDVAIIADDPFRCPVELPIRVVRVPPVTRGEACDAMGRDAARATLGLRAEGRVVLVAAGGGGDEDAVLRATSIAQTIRRVAPEVTVALALGPLVLRPDAEPRSTELGVRIVRAAPLQPLLAAFDGAFAPAGYNTAHELAKAGVVTALFAQPRPFDDQAARAARFASSSLAMAIDAFDDGAIDSALAWMKTAPRPAIEAGGADRAADALIELVMGPDRERAAK